MNFTFIPTPKNASDAAFQTRVIDRAVTLWEDGYTVTWGRDEFPGDNLLAQFACVKSPEGKLYAINLIDETCACECCKKNGFCKHLIAVVVADRDLHDAQQVAQMEEYYANR